MVQKLSEFFKRAVEAVFPSEKNFESVLASGKKLKIYIGIDPTSHDLHLGHSTNFLLLKELQELGHKIILLVGDFTAMIGDPSGRTSVRKPLTREEIEANLTTYKQQAEKIITFTGQNPAEFKFNSQWLDQLSLRDFIQIAANTTIKQLIERDMFQKRIAEGNPISAHEFLYPLLQGYDSVAMNIDLEVGGTDQTFNMLVGRELVKRYLNKEKFVITTKLLVNPKTGRKLMSKTEGNYVSLQEKPNDMYGKIMSMSDEVVPEFLNLCTLLTNEVIEGIQRLKIMETKKRLAFEIVKMYHGEKQAKFAEASFKSIIQEKQIPKSIPVIAVKTGATIAEILVMGKLATSMSDAKRLVNQGAVSGVRNSGHFTKFTNLKYVPETNFILKKGTREYRRVQIKK